MTNEQRVHDILAGVADGLMPQLAAASALINMIEANQGLKFSDFAAANHKRCTSPEGFNQARITDWSLADWMVALTGEVGEAANVLKKLNRDRDGYAGNDLSADDLRAEFKKECGDIGVYLDLMCQAAGFTMEEAMVEVFNAKSEKIGYPERIGDG